MKKVLVLHLVFVLFCLPLMAQENVATVTGTVADESGGIIPGVEVTLTNVDTGSQRTALTNDSGIYAFNGVPVGSYSLTASMAGFKTLEQTGMRSVAGETLTLDVKLSVGQVTDTIEVTAALPTIEKQSNKAGYARVSEEITRLPLTNSTSNREALSFLRCVLQPRRFERSKCHEYGLRAGNAQFFIQLQY